MRRRLENHGFLPKYGFFQIMTTPEDLTIWEVCACESEVLTNRKGLKKADFLYRTYVPRSGQEYFGKNHENQENLENRLKSWIFTKICGFSKFNNFTASSHAACLRIRIRSAFRVQKPLKPDF